MVNEDQNMWKAGDYANVPSGLGGMFSVKLLEAVGDGYAVEVQNPGFEGMRFTTKASAVTAMDDASRQWLMKKEREAKELAARKKKHRW